MTPSVVIAGIGAQRAHPRAAGLCLLIAAALVVACEPQPSAAPTFPGASVGGASSAPVSTGPLDSAAPSAPAAELSFNVQTFPVPGGAGPHDVAPASDGGVWYTGQRNGRLGWLDPETGRIEEVDLGPGSAPHGVISGPDGAAWVTDPGLDALVRVEPSTFAVAKYPMPSGARDIGLHTAVFDRDGILWFTGQQGYVGRFDPGAPVVEVFAAPRGAGPYGITVTPTNDVYVASLQQSYLGGVDRAAFSMRVLEPPTRGAGVRRAWSDSKGRVWISEWNAGQLGMYDPATGTWREWPLDGPAPMAYAIYVDELDAVWLSDFGSNSILRFDPVAETFLRFPSTSNPANVRQLLGRRGEVWGAESAADKLIVIRFGPG
jgi:virginiamycin B lyase